MNFANVVFGRSIQMVVLLLLVILLVVRVLDRCRLCLMSWRGVVRGLVLLVCVLVLGWAWQLYGSKSRCINEDSEFYSM